MSSKALIVNAVCAMFIVVPIAGAEQLTIIQESKAFSKKNVNISVGDTINFANNDKKTHNVYSRSKGHKFDIGAQRPGTSASHTFTAPGKVKVRCAIHPRMKLTVNVE
ncbi:MAG: cupredoxin domain-containing protein [Geminicoccaceae bacterium]